MESAQPSIESSYNLESIFQISATLMRKELVRLLRFALIPLTVLTVLTFVIIGSNLTNRNEAEDLKHMQYVQSQVDFIISELDALNLTFCVNKEITRTLYKAFDLNDTQAIASLKRLCTNYMVPTVAAHDHIHSMYFYTDNQQGMFLTSSGSNIGPALITQYEDSGWYDGYQQMLDNRVDFSAQRRQVKLFSFESAPTNVITLYRQLYLRNGVIVLNLHQEYFDNMLANQTTSASQILLTANENHEILMQSSGSQTFSEDVVAALCAADEKALRTFEIDGRKWFVTRMPSGNRYHWTYLSLTPIDEANAFLRDMFMLLGLIFFPTLLVCTLVAWKYSRRYCRNALQILNTLEAAERHEEDLSKFNESSKDFYGMVTQKIVRNYAERNYLRYQLEQKQRSVREMELCALRSQVNPHFLFNTLKSIYWMSVSQAGGPNEVSRMIENMTEILEYSLDDADEMASLQDEIRNTRAYITIQHMRYQERFSVEWHYNPEIETYYTVKMLLQPLVENAIMHGMRWNEGMPLRIQISIEKHDDFIEIKVSDDGVGIPIDELRKIRSRLQSHSDEGHIGLYSCNKRLCLTFGDECGIQVSSENGVTISLRFPCLME